MMQKKYVFDPYPLQVTMQRLAENLKARRLEKKLSTKSLSEMSGVPASSIQRFELKHSISLESYVKLAKALGYSEEIMQLLAEPQWKNCLKSTRTVQESVAYDQRCSGSQCDVSWT